MTEENYNYRTSWTLLRNQFPGTGKLKMPLIPKFEPRPDDFIDLLLIGFDKTHLEDQNHLDRMVHFFLYDYRFERVWKNPDSDLERLSRYRAVLSPDFSMYLEMAPVMQLYNTFRNRWCGAYWASKGMRVIPTVNWGDESTFDFCFEGIEKGSVVAVSTYMASEHDHRSDQKEWFMAGYNEMLQRIEPEKIICYNMPFPEMQGDIVYVDYERSSWRHMNYERSYNSVRTVYIDNKAICLLVEDRKNHPFSPYLFPSPVTGGMYGPDCVGRIHKKLLKRAGIEKHVRFHDLRRTFATMALQNGVDIKTVSGMLGHYSTEFTLDVYTNVTKEMQKDAAKKIGGFMAEVM